MSTKAERRLARDVVKLQKELDAANRALGEFRKAKTDAAAVRQVHADLVKNLEGLRNVTTTVPIWVNAPDLPQGGFWSKSFIVRAPMCPNSVIADVICTQGWS